MTFARSRDILLHVFNIRILFLLFGFQEMSWEKTLGNSTTLWPIFHVVDWHRYYYFSFTFLVFTSRAFGYLGNNTQKTVFPFDSTPIFASRFECKVAVAAIVSIFVFIFSPFDVNCWLFPSILFSSVSVHLVACFTVAGNNVGGARAYGSTWNKSCVTFHQNSNLSLLPRKFCQTIW